MIKFCWIYSLIFLLPFSIAQAAVWQNQNQWNSEFEIKYSNWVKENFTQEIFFRSGPYQNIPTDCADATYGMRLIFSYENNLPFAIQDPSSSGKLISNNISKFDSISDPLQRFRAFMEWIMDLTDTGSLSNDSYPIEISRDQITPGTLYLATRTHSYQIVDLNKFGVPTLQYSTTPKQVRSLSRTTIFPHYVPGQYKPRKYADGFRKFRNPNQYFGIDSRLPGYSLEQFMMAEQVDGVAPAFYDWAIQKLQSIPEMIGDKAERYVVALCFTAWDRAEAVYDAQNYLRKIGGRCMNASEYDQHSTPGRDKKLKSYFEQLNRLPSDSGWKNLSGQYKNYVDLILGRISDSGQIENALIDLCDVNRQVGGPGRPMSIAELYRVIESGNLVSDPNATVLQRWGISNYSPNCPQY